MKILFIFFSFFLANIALAQVGVGTTDPKATLDVKGKPSVPSEVDGFIPPRISRLQLTAKTGYGVNQAGAIVYVTDISGDTSLATAQINSVGIYCFDGAVWRNSFTEVSHIIGDTKQGFQSTDHNGWVKLDGRLKNSLNANQKANATTLGIGDNLPDATNAFLVQNGAVLTTISGSNAKLIEQGNLPNIAPSITIGSVSAGTPSGSVSIANTSATMQSAGNHQHFAISSLWGDFAYTPTWNYNAAFAQAANQGSNPFSYDGAYVNGLPDSGATSVAGNHVHTIDPHSHSASFSGSSLPTHNHTATASSINGNVTQRSLDVTPKSLSVNTFIYLGN